MGGASSQSTQLRSRKLAPQKCIMYNLHVLLVKGNNSGETAMQSILKMSAVGAILLLGATCVSALEGNFNQPHYKDGSRLDVCFAFGQDCGQRPADVYCRVQGYQRAASFETEHARPTQIAGDGKTCDANFCAAFSHIVCFTPEAQRGQFNPELWPHIIDR